MGAIVVIGGIIILVPLMGILGAGVALLAAEITTSTGYARFATKWLHQNSLIWPKKSFMIATTSVVISAFAMAAMIFLPHLNWLIVAVSMILLAGNFWRYWRVLPTLVTHRAVQIIRNLPGIRKVFATRHIEPIK
jgi:O-antigen/teichoic acid export membrane protein